MDLRMIWGPRKETLEACVARFQKFIGPLSRLTDSEWYAIWSRKKGEQRVDLENTQGIINLFDKGRNREDGRVFESLGYRVSLWSCKHAEHEITLSLKCGLYLDKLSNVSIMEMEPQSPVLRNAEQAIAICQCFIDSWEPEEVAIFSDDLLDARRIDADVFFIDWVHYAKGLFITPEECPAAYQIFDTQTGSILVTSKEEPTPTPEHISAVEEIEAVYRGKGWSHGFSSKES